MFLTYFSTLGGVSSLNVILTEFINSKLSISKGWIKQLISWLVPMIISIIGFVFGFGLFADYGTITSVTGWIYTTLTGLGMGLISNGLYDLTFVQNAIDTTKSLIANVKINNN